MKTLYLCRGLPGSGKTTLAKLIAPDYHYAADDYWEENSVDRPSSVISTYRGTFDPKKLPLAHKQCLDRATAAMQSGATPIAVHNTFSQSWEAANYFLAAEKHGYSVFVIECQNKFGSVHDVPKNVIHNMEWRWEKTLERPDTTPPKPSPRLKELKARMKKAKEESAQ